MLSPACRRAYLISYIQKPGDPGDKSQFGPKYYQLIGSVGLGARAVSRKTPIYFIKEWSVDHIIIVMFIIECPMRGSAEMCQIHTQWSHFLRLAVTVDFDDISL